MRHPLAAALIVVAASAAAAAPAASPAPAESPLTPITDETLSSFYGGVVETRLDADFNGDGHVDSAAVMADEEHEVRSLHVAIGYVDEGGMGHDPIDGMGLEPYALAPASLSMKGNVLIVEELTGGTTAIASTYRFRYDPEEHRMRLIGDDVSHYSRTNTHGSLEISTNRLTGQRIRQEMKLNEDPAPGDDAAYLPQPEVRETVDRTPIYMAEAPTPAETLGVDDPDAPDDAWQGD